MNICDCLCENRPYWHNNWNPFYGLTLKLHSPTVRAHQTHGGRYPSLLSKRAFLEPVTPWTCITGPLEPLDGTNKDVCGAKLSPTTVSAYPVDCGCLCHLLDTLYCCVSLNGRVNPPSASQPPPPTPAAPLPPPAHPLIQAICDITVTVKKIAQKPVVLAS